MTAAGGNCFWRHRGDIGEHLSITIQLCFLAVRLLGLLAINDLLYVSVERPPNGQPALC